MELAGELYLVPPARFVATRDEVAHKARAAGHRELARQLQALRRPTLSAWLVNVLARHERAAMEDLATLGRRLRHAQIRLDGSQLRQLSKQRHQLVGELLHLARQQALDAGVEPTDRMLCEVEATLHAALVDLAASSAVLSGRLVRPMSYNGFGPRPQLPLDSPAAPAPASARTAPVPVPLLAMAPGSRPPAPPEGPEGPEQDEWVFWPVPSPAAAERGAAQPAGPVTFRPFEEERPRRPPEERRQVDERPAEERRQVDERRPARQERPRRLRLVPPTGTRPGAQARPDPACPEGALAAAESAHWRREQQLAAAEEAVQAARDELDWFEQHRMVARSEKVDAERRLAQARSAQQASIRALVEARRALDDAETRFWPTAGHRDDD
jgi:hypothetical protein